MFAMKYSRKRHQLVGRTREVGEVEPRVRLEAQLAGRASLVPVEVLDHAVGGVAQLADVEDVGVRVVLGAARDGRTADDHGPAVRVRAAHDVVDVRTLDVHARRRARRRPTRKSASVARREFSSTKRTSHAAGRYAATTSRPCGGMNAVTRPPNSGYECWKVPNDFAYSGNTHRIRRTVAGVYAVRMRFVLQSTVLGLECGTREVS